MALTLEDIQGMPNDPDELYSHLVRNGHIQPPAPLEDPNAPLVKPTVITQPLSPVTKSEPRETMPLSPVSKGMGPATGIDRMAMISATSQPTMPDAHETKVSEMTPPEIGTGPMPGATPDLSVKPLGPVKPQRPDVTAPVNSSEFWKQKIAQELYDKENHWGTPGNHPGFGGKLAHALSEIGQVAGTIVSPGAVAAIPGTHLNRGMRINAELGNEATAEGRELAAKTEATKEKHEENVADTNDQKLQNAQDKLDNEQKKTLNARELGLRKQGLKPNPADPNGPPIPLAREDMSETESAIVDLKQAQTDGAKAKAALDTIKADPNSPQSQAALARVRIMAQNAATSAGKLGLDKDKFVADYFGLDPQGNPIAGTQKTPEGKPVGPKIANATKSSLSELNKNYVKPANDIEKSYQMANHAYNEYKAARAAGKELPTGAQSMVQLSTHLATTFGNVKGARITKDMIHEHLGARSISDSMLVAMQRFTNGDQLSPDQWQAFNDLMTQSRKLSWTTAVKEAKRSNNPVNFLPDDLNDELGGEKAAKPGATLGAGAQPPRPANPGMEWRRNKKTGEFKEFPVTQ